MDKRKESSDLKVVVEEKNDIETPIYKTPALESKESLTSGAKDLAENLSLLQNLDKFKLDHDELIDISIPIHPGVTNAGVTKQASLYIASLNLLQIFDMMDHNCDGCVPLRDLAGLLNSSCSQVFGGYTAMNEKLISAFKRVILLKRPETQSVLYREFPRLITYMCDQDVMTLKSAMSAMHHHLSKNLPSRSPRMLKFDSTAPGNRVAIEENPMLREIVESLPLHRKILNMSWWRYCFDVTFRRFTSIHAFVYVFPLSVAFSCL